MGLKKLYREIARRIHPDLAEGEAERARRNKLMSDANNAYEEGDEELLRAILYEWKNSPESVKGDGVGADLVRIIRKVAQIQERLKNLESEIIEIESSDLFQLKTKVEEAQRKGKDLLQEMAEAIEREILHARIKLDKLKDKEASL